MPPPKEKKIANVSAMFAVHGKRPSDNVSTPARGAMSKKQKKAQLTEDSIAEQLRESLNLTATHLATTSQAALDRTHSTLLTRLADASAAAEHYVRTEETVRTALATPLGEELLRLRQRSGETLEARLDQRMAGYGKKMAKLATGIERLRGELKRNRGEVGAVWRELQRAVEDARAAQMERAGKLGSEDVGGTGTGDNAGIVDGDRESCGKKGVAESGGMREFWEGRIQALVEEKMRGMREAEKALDLKEKRRSDKWAMAIKTVT